MIYLSILSIGIPFGISNILLPVTFRVFILFNEYLALINYLDSLF